MPTKSTTYLSYLFTLTLFLQFLVSAHAANRQDAEVVFLSPTHKDSPFFKTTATLMQTVADDLSLKLEIVHGEDLVVISDQARAILARDTLPDYLLISGLPDITDKLMVEANRLGIKILLFNTGLDEHTTQTLRQGDTALEHWIGQVLPDDQQAGSLLARKLIEKARSIDTLSDSGHIHLVGINGSIRSPAGRQRELGLRNYVANQPDVDLQQVIYTNWMQSEAHQKTKLLLQRFEQVSVVWTAADALAFGAADAIKQQANNGSTTVLTAGVDWLPQVSPLIASGQIAGSVGGHLFDAAWALVTIYDHLHGHTQGFVDEQTQFYWVDKNNLHAVEALLQEDQWKKINFLDFTKAHSGREHYDFGVHNLLLNPLHLNSE